MNPTANNDALTRGFFVKSRRMTGMMLIGEMVTTNASGSISATTTFNNKALLSIRTRRRSYPSEVTTE
jgi:hypothetical protein